MLSKWIDQIEQKINTAIDYIAEGEDEENEAEQSTVVDIPYATTLVTGHVPFSETDGFFSQMLPIHLDNNTLAKSNHALTETRELTETFDEAHPLRQSGGVVDEETRKAVPFPRSTVDSHNGQTWDTAAACNAIHPSMVNYAEDKLLPSSVEPNNTISNDVSKELELFEARRPSKEANEKVMAIRPFTSTTSSFPETSSKVILSSSNVAQDVVIGSTENYPRLSEKAEPSHVLPQLQETTSQFIKEDSRLGMQYPLLEKNIPSRRSQDQLPVDVVSADTLNENSILKKRISDLQMELTELKQSTSTSKSTKDEVGRLIDALRRERERSKLISEERSVLLDKVNGLEILLQNYKATNNSVETERMQGETLRSLKSDNSKFEEEPDTRKQCIVELSTKMSKAEYTNASLMTRIQNNELEQVGTLSKLKNHHLDVQSRLEKEVDRLKEALQEAQLELEEQRLTMERKVFEANQRVSIAERRLAEAEFRSASFLNDLKIEMEDTQKRVAFLLAELDGVKNERAEMLEKYNKLRDQYTAEENIHQEQQARRIAALAESNKQIQLLKEEVSAYQQKVFTAQHEIEHLKRQCIILQAAGLKTPPPEKVDVRRTIVDLEQDSSKNSLKTSNVILERPYSSSTERAQQDERMLSSSRLFYDPRPAEVSVLFTSVHTNDTTSSYIRQEKEIIRQAAEIERLKGFEVEVIDLRRKFAELTNQYDLLLQMYGQLEEEYSTQKQLLTGYGANENHSDPVAKP